jgi:hypothetical protein
MNIEVSMAQGSKNTVSYKDVDFSSFTQADVVNLILQRSSTLDNQQGIRDWMAGDASTLKTAAKEERDSILQVAFEEIADVYGVIRNSIATIAPKRIADIGAGYSFVDLMLYKEFGCDLVLIDIETSDDRHFGFQDAGAGYSSLSKARKFLMDNGVPSSAITTLNPQKKPVDTLGEVDLAISLISCGFHYPAETYDAFFRKQVSADGGIVIDIRKGSGALKYLKQIGDVQILEADGKRVNIFVRKSADYVAP